MTSLFFISSVLLLSISLDKYWLWCFRMWGFAVGSFMSILCVYKSLTSFSVFNYFFSMTSLSSALVVLSFWISFLMMLASNYSVLSGNKYVKSFSFTVSFLNLMLLLAFCATNMLVFYVFFEGCLIPTLFLILGWGYQPERLEAGMYMMVYTVSASLPFLVILIMKEGSLNKLVVFSEYFSSSVVVILFSIFAFMVKLPVYSVHLWLPKAHVEAPISGSMVLAGVLLKLGGFGLIQTILFFKFFCFSFNIFVIVWSLWGGLLTGFVCMRQSDLKSLIAYSSVGHMSLVFSGIMSYSSWGWSSGFMMMISHGLVSSGLFCLANILYESCGSRSLMLLRGFSSSSSLMLWWFLFSMSNIPTPPSISMMSEILIFPALLHLSIYFFFVLVFMGMVSATYNLLMFTCIQHGWNDEITISPSMNKSNHMLLLFHYLPLLALTLGMMKMVFF